MKKFTLMMAFLGITSFAHANTVNSETAQATDALGASMVSEVKFKEGQVLLTKEEQAEIADIVSSARAAGDIDEIKVIAWADREFPARGTSAANASVKLAEERADHIKKYLKDDLKVGSVSTYNMAKRTNTLQDFLNTPTARIKRSLENTGAAPTRKEDTGFLGLKGKASAALVLVYLK